MNDRRSWSSAIAITALTLALASCVLVILAWRERGWTASTIHPSPTADEWLNGPVNAQLHSVERQLRGLDVAMMEIGYRFTELYFAGLDGNWDYASYQTQKIDLALRLALERREKRRASSQPFLDEDLPFVSAVIEARDPARFRESMDRLRTACMKCHTNEKVPYFTVELPEHRMSTIRTIR